MSENQPPQPPTGNAPPAGDAPLTDAEKARFGKFLDEWLSSDAGSAAPSGGAAPTNPPAPPSGQPAPAPTSQPAPDLVRAAIREVLDERDQRSSASAEITALKSKVAELEQKVGARKVRAWFSPLVG